MRACKVHPRAAHAAKLRAQRSEISEDIAILYRPVGYRMSDSLLSAVQCLQSTLCSKSSHRGAQAAQAASDLYTLCVESVSGIELGNYLLILYSTLMKIEVS